MNNLLKTLFKGSATLLMMLSLTWGMTACADWTDDTDIVIPDVQPEEPDEPDEPVDPQVDPVEEYKATGEAMPTTDQMEQSIEGLTYVFSANYTNEGQALVKRALNQTSDVADEGIKNVIMHQTNWSGEFNNEELSVIFRALGEGGSLMMADFTPDERAEMVLSLYNALKDAIDGSSSIEYLNTADYSNLLNMLQWAKTVSEDVSAEKNSTVIPVSGISRDRQFVMINTPQSYMAITDASTATLDVANCEFTMEEIIPNEYVYGSLADEAAAWMNVPADTKSQQLALRMTAANKIAATRGNTDINIEDIATAQRYQLVKGMYINYLEDKDGNPGYMFHKLMIDRNVYTAYIADEGRDYFCVDQKVTLKNGDVSVDKKYILENGDKTVSIMNFGPYMKQFSNVTIPWTKDFVTIDAKLEQYAPDAQSGSYSTSIDFGTNPSINTLGPISDEDLSVNYSYTIPSFSADLNLTVNSTSNGKIIWDYQGNVSGTPASLNDIPEALRTDCSLEQSWVWSASLDDDEIYIFTAPQLIDQASVVVVDKTGTIANTTSNYLYAGLPVVYSADGTPTNIVTDAEILEDYQNSFAQMVTCAPHFKQNWTMSIESNYSIVDANDIAEGLKKTFGNYIWENGSFNTRKPFDAYDIAEEVTAYVKEAQTHFANNSSEMISVGRNLGMLTGTYYTIYWIAPNGAKVFKHRVVIR